MALLARRWTPMSDDAGSPPDSSSFCFMQWNVLADGLAQHGSFAFCDPAHLRWNARFPLIAAELKSVDADIVCLQEMNHADSYADLLSSYSMVVVPKLRSPATFEFAPADGCALFIRRSRFELLDVDVVYYLQSGKVLEGLSNQNAVVCLLRDKLTSNMLVVATTHLKAKGGAESERLRSQQIEQLMGRIKAMRAKAQAALAEAGLPGGGAVIPVLLSGDFNSPPTEPVFAAAYGDTDLGLQSVYNSHRRAKSAHGPAAGAAVGSRPEIEAYIAGEPAFTTWKTRKEGGGVVEKRRTIDYIFASELLAPEGDCAGVDGAGREAATGGGPTAASSGAGVAPAAACARLQLLAIRELPTAEEIGPEALPSAHYPSDHLSLAARFRWV